MREHTLYLLLAGWGLLAASCYDDKSTLQTTHIPPVEIEVPEAIASQLTVVHNARLDITGIRITKDGRENPEELTYEWTVSQTDNDSEAISLATTREFHEVIDLPISSKGYLFLLTVTDTAHDLKYQYKWTLIVTAQFNEGLVVAYTRDGTTSDLGLIMHLLGRGAGNRRKGADQPAQRQSVPLGGHPHALHLRQNRQEKHPLGVDRRRPDARGDRLLRNPGP